MCTRCKKGKKVLYLSKSKELQEAIETGKIAEHPSWEDMILIENRDTKIKKLEKKDCKYCKFTWNLNQ